MRALDRWRALEPNERRLTARAAVALASAAWRLKVTGVRGAMRWAHDAAASSEPADGVAPAAAMAVDRAGRYMPGASCLVRSLALTRLLRQAGLPAAVRFGVSDASNFQAHAWVECAGTALTDARGATCLPPPP